MDRMTFLSNIIDALAWPTIALIILLAFRRPMKDLFPLIRRLKYGDFEVEFAREVLAVRRDVAAKLPNELERAGPSKAMSALANSSPRAAVLEAWQDVETACIDFLRAQEGPTFTLTRETLERLKKQEALDPSLVRRIFELRSLRNDAAHAPEFSLSNDAALAYAETAQALALHLRKFASQASGRSQ